MFCGTLNLETLGRFRPKVKMKEEFRLEAVAICVGRNVGVKKQRL